MKNKRNQCPILRRGGEDVKMLMLQHGSPLNAISPVNILHSFVTYGGAHLYSGGVGGLPPVTFLVTHISGGLISVVLTGTGHSPFPGGVTGIQLLCS